MQDKVSPKLCFDLPIICSYSTISDMSRFFLFFSLDTTSIIPQQYPLEEQKSASIERACRLNKDSRVSADIRWFRTTEQGTLQIQSEPGYRVLDHDNQVLRFISLRSLTDEGQFTCRVYSVAGNASASYNITIIEVPLQPNANAVIADAPRTITITWNAPFNGNRPILNYRVRRRETSTGKEPYFRFILLSPKILVTTLHCGILIVEMVEMNNAIRFDDTNIFH